MPKLVRFTGFNHENTGAQTMLNYGTTKRDTLEQNMKDP